MESEPSIEPPAVYQHPLAYLLGLEGVALLRAFSGEYDRDFTMARLAEIRALLDSAEELGDGAVVDAISTTEGYSSWADFYDQPGNQLIELEQPIVREIVDGLPSWSRRTSEYLAAALPLGLHVRRCEEPLRPFPLVDDNGWSDGVPESDHVPGEPPNIWALHRWCPAATNAAYRDLPIAIIWHFELGRA